MNDPGFLPGRSDPDSSPDHPLPSHADLHQAFDAFVAEMARRYEQPEELLLLASVLGRNLGGHLRREEELVLPWWAAAEPEPPANATGECFQEDHRLLLQRVLEVRLEALRAAARPTGAWRRREALAALDDLMEHHDQREQEYLYQRLERDPDPRARELRGQLAATALVPVAQVEARATEWRGGAAAQILAAYRAWASGPKQAPSGGWDFLPPAARERAGLLAERDRRLVRDFLQADEPDPRRRMARERRVEQTLQRTALVLVDALLDPWFEAGA